MAFNINFDDNNSRIYIFKYVFGGNRNCWRSNDFLPFILSTVQVLLCDEVGGPRHVVVLGLQVGVEQLSGLVTAAANSNQSYWMVQITDLMEL